MADLHLVQVGWFKPLVEKLRTDIGNVQRLEHQCGLDTYRLDKPDNYVPLHCFYNLLEAISRQEGMTTIPRHFVDVIKFVNISQVAKHMVYTPDLLRALQQALKHANKILTNEQTALIINGTETRLNFKFFDRPVKGRDHAIQLNIAYILNAFQLACGKDWAPLEIHLETDTEPDFDAFLPTGYKTKIVLNQATSAIVFPTNMLAMPMLAKNAPAGITQDLPHGPLSLISKIEQLMESQANETIPSLDQVAEIADVSPRTLKRRLAQEGTTFFEVVDKWRFKTAVRMLSNSNATIKEISSSLGYTYLRNFYRSFNRWTNQTPQQYLESV